MAYLRQKKLEELNKENSLIWSYYFWGMSKLCKSIELFINSPLDSISLRTVCSEASQNFDQYKNGLENDVPFHKRQISCFTDVIRIILHYKDIKENVFYLLSFRKKDSSFIFENEIDKIVEQFDYFSHTYDEFPSWRDMQFLSLLIELMNLMKTYNKKSHYNISMKVNLLQATYSGSQSWKYIFLKRIADILKMGDTKFYIFYILEKTSPWLEAIAFICLVLAGLLSIQFVQKWISDYATLYLHNISFYAGIFTGLLSVISLFFRKTSKNDQL